MRTETPPSTAPAPAASAIDAELTIRTRLSPFWSEADVPEIWPADNRSVIALISVLGYAIDDAEVHRLIDAKLFVPPEMVAGRRRWHATDVMSLIALLESRRAWRPFHKLHHWKLSPSERALALLREHGGTPETMFSDLAEHDLRSLLLLMTTTDHTQAREFIRTAIEVVLSRDHGVKV